MLDTETALDVEPITVRARSARTYEVADLLCGAGGSSTGAEIAIKRLGGKMKLVALNHWQPAIDTHTANHPTAVHFCQDVDVVKPREAVPSGRLDLLLATPECIFHSRARGARPINDQKRSTPWCVQRWCADLYVARFLVENVPEFQDWGPVDAKGRPLKSRKGETFRAWVAALEAMGYRVEWRIINSADYGDPTTRRRLMIQGARDNRKIRWAEPLYSQMGLPDLLGSRKRWRAAREVIDWTKPGKSVFLRPVPLRPNTIRRLAAGVTRFFGPLAPFYLEMLALELVRSIARWGDEARGSRPARPVGGAEVADGACLIELRGSGTARSVDRPMPAITTGGGRGGGHLMVAAPWLMPQGANGAPRDTDDPMPALVTAGKPALVQPFLMGQHAGNAPRSTEEPVMTVCAGGNSGTGIGVAAALINMKGRSTSSSLDAPAPAITAHARHLGLAQPFIVPVTHSGGGNRSRSIDDPLSTVTCAARGELGLVEPFLMPYYRTGTPAPVDEPLGTLTATARFGTAQPFLIPFFGERLGQTPRVHSIDEPLPAPTSHGAGALVEAYGLDLMYRMLENSELAGAMGFNEAPRPYRFLGTKTQVTRQIGNAVSVNMAAELIHAMLAL